MRTMYATVVKYDNNFTVENNKGVSERKPLYELNEIVLITKDGRSKNWYGKIYVDAAFVNFNIGGRYKLYIQKIKRNYRVTHTEWVNGGDPEIVKSTFNINYIDYFKVVNRRHEMTPVVDEWKENYGDE